MKKKEMKKEDKLRRKITKVVEAIVAGILIFLIIGFLIWKNFGASETQKAKIDVQTSTINIDGRSESGILMIIIEKISNVVTTVANYERRTASLIDGILQVVSFFVIVVFSITLPFTLSVIIRNILLPIHLIGRPIIFLTILFGKKLGWFQELNESRQELYKNLPSAKFLKISGRLYSEKTQKEVFEQIAGEWNDEVYKVLEKNKDASLFMTNARNTYFFLKAMWQKSPIGDLIEFISKIAK